MPTTMLPVIAAQVAKSASGREWLYVETPYLPEFPERAKALGGKWTSLDIGDFRAIHAWRFDPRDADRVAELCVELFGYSWMNRLSVKVQSIRLGLPMERYGTYGEIFGFGRMLIREKRGRRDSWLELGWGVLLLAGSFYAKTGQMVLEVRDVPANILDREADRWLAKNCTIDLVQHAPPRSLPQPEEVNRLPYELNAEVQTILEAWDRLDARTQGDLLEILRDRLPGGYR